MKRADYLNMDYEPVVEEKAEPVKEEAPKTSALDNFYNHGGNQITRDDVLAIGNAMRLNERLYGMAGGRIYNRIIRRVQIENDVVTFSLEDPNDTSAGVIVVALSRTELDASNLSMVGLLEAVSRRYINIQEAQLRGERDFTANMQRRMEERMQEMNRRFSDLGQRSNFTGSWGSLSSSQTTYISTATAENPITEVVPDQPSGKLRVENTPRPSFLQRLTRWVKR